MKFDTQTFDSDAFLVATLWARARAIVVGIYADGARVWPHLSLETRIIFFERAAEAMGVPLR